MYLFIYALFFAWFFSYIGGPVGGIVAFFSVIILSILGSMRAEQNQKNQKE